MSVFIAVAFAQQYFTFDFNQNLFPTHSELIENELKVEIWYQCKNSTTAWNL